MYPILHSLDTNRISFIGKNPGFQVYEFYDNKPWMNEKPKSLPCWISRNCISLQKYRKGWINPTKLSRQAPDLTYCYPPCLSLSKDQGEFKLNDDRSWITMTRAVSNKKQDIENEHYVDIYEVMCCLKFCFIINQGEENGTNIIVLWK